MTVPSPASLATPCTWQALLDWVADVESQFSGTVVPESGITTTTSAITLTA
jgi:hypothetical protein